MRNNKYDWSYLSKYRNSIYGIAIILIIAFHYFILVQKTEGIFATIARVYSFTIGSVGVDIFMIMSGVCLFYSLKRNPNVLEFYKKRCKRIIVPYIIVSFMFWYIRDIALEPLGTKRLIKDMTFYTFFTEGDRSLWYILAIMIVYLIYPLLFKIYDSLKKNSEIVTLLLICVVIGFNYLIDFYNADIYDNIEIMLERFPAAVLGAYLGKRVYNKEKIKLMDMGIVIVCVIINTIIDITRVCDIREVGMRVVRYTQIARGVVFIFLIVFIVDKISKKKIVEILNKIGEYSLELYLVHVTVLSVFKKIHMRNTKIICFLVYLVITIGLVQGLRRLCDKIYGLLENKKITQK